ncbi:CHAP domain-containing protein [Acinetobacter pragensis]|uniref:CHAP domain-containing protein n=1 Tax=Acinetobacter pragensis TaxID=1806892 RepID=UPI0033427CA1
MADTWTAFTAIPNDTQILNHGYSQCVALANLYNEETVGGEFVPVASAYQWWTERGSLPQIRDSYTPSSTPKPGALFVARGGLYDARDGHIGVVTGVNADGSFNTMEQNAGRRYVGRYTRTRDANVLGFLIPKPNPAAPAAPLSEEDDMTIYIRRDSAGTVYAYSPLTGKARALTTLQWTVTKRAYANAGLKLPLTEEGPAAMKALVGKER